MDLSVKELSACKVSPDEEKASGADVESILATPVKTSAAQMTNVKDLGAKFLSHSYPSWKVDSATYMIPTIFEPKGSKSVIGTTGKIPYSDSGDLGESIVYNLLKEFGNKNKIGMFVVHGFKLYKVLKWNEDYAAPLPIKGDATKECDFMIFHHNLGVIHMEVKNCGSNNIETILNRINKACEQLQRGKSLVKGFVKPNLLHWEVVCLPSTTKCALLANNVFSKYSDKHFLLSEDVKNIDTFEAWWKSTFEASCNPSMTSIQTQAYEEALSYIVMICHLTPMSESDYVIELSTALNTYTHMKQISYLHPQNFKEKYPDIIRWYGKVCTSISYVRASPTALVEGIEKKLRQKNNKAGLAALNAHLKNNEFVIGNVPSVCDKNFMEIIKSKHLISFDNIVRFYNNMKCVFGQAEGIDLDSKQIQLKLDSVEDINRLELELADSASPFIHGDKPTVQDYITFQLLSQNFCISDTHVQIVLTPDQLSIFEGPKKQLIIGGPGSGKTELLKAKAKQLAMEIKATKSCEKILYIIATGSPSGDPLLMYEMKEFFKKFQCVDVRSIIIEEENPIQLDDCKEELRKLMSLKISGSLQYAHVFIDEYWVGCKPAEHEIILELIRNIPNYAWISSVFDFDIENEKTKLRTGPLLEALKEVKGCVSYVRQIVRGTDSIITLEKSYSALYEMRSYPYGTKKMYGHSLEGVPIQWKNAKDVTSMYHECIQTIDSAIQQSTVPDAEQFPHFPKKPLSPSHILVVDFAVRSKESRDVVPTLKEQLLASHVPMWSFGENMEQYLYRTKLTLLSSKTRKESTYLDGMEWPMVIVILPSGVLLNKDIIADGAERLRNYDTYISFFRAQVQLIILSDKWKCENEFLKDIAQKEK